MSSMKIINKEAFFKRMEKRLGPVATQNAKKACFRAANLVKNEAQTSIAQGAKTGATSTRYDPKRQHRASAAGEPPASDKGFLVSNITSEVDVSRDEIIGIVRSSAPYSAFLEFGTVRMAARPFMQPALEKNADKIEAIFKKEGITS